MVEAVLRDPLSAPLSPVDQALVRYAEKLTLRPAQVTAADLEPLRSHGFDDRAIHDTVQIVSLFSYYNRMADGLGVELSDDCESGEKGQPSG